MSMKITDIRITPVAVPVKPAKSESKMRMGPRVLLEVMVEIFTDEGIVGIGESPCFARLVGEIYGKNGCSWYERWR